MSRAETPFLHRPVSSLEVPGFVIDKIGEDLVTPKGSPFRDGFIPDFSRVVTSYRRPKQSSPQFVQVSPTHKRSFETHYGPTQFILWEDEFGTLFGAHQEKGGNLSRPDVRIEKRAPSGFIIWGIQDSDSILRTVRASQVMREEKIATEAIVRVIEPSQLPYKGEMVPTPEFKKQLIQNVWDANHRKSTQNEDGWLAVPRTEVPKLASELKDMTFYLTTVARQVSECFLDLKFASSQEDLEQVMGKVFTFWNVRNKLLKSKGQEPLSEVLDSKNPADVLRFFTQFLPKEVARNYGKLHNRRLVHTYPHLGNVSLVGSIKDIDSVYGAPLGLGDKDVTDNEIMDDVTCLIDGKEGFQHADGIAHLLSKLEKNRMFPDGIEVSKAFSRTFALEYIKTRGWDSDISSNLGNINKLFRICGIYLLSEREADFVPQIKEAFGEKNSQTLHQYYLSKSYGSPFHSTVEFPLVVSYDQMPDLPESGGEPAQISEMNPERRSEVLKFVKNSLDMHARHISYFPDIEKRFFSFPPISKALIKMHNGMNSQDVIDSVSLWTNGDLEDLLKGYHPKATGEFLLSLGQLNIYDLIAGVNAVKPTLDDPLLIEKLSHIHEFFEVLPRIYDFREYLNSLVDIKRSWYDLEKETSYRAGIALFGRGIITQGFHEIFNHNLREIILNEFTKQQELALKAGFEDPDLIDPLMGKENTMIHLQLGLTGVQVRSGQIEGLSIIALKDLDSWGPLVSGHLQYFFASEGKDKLIGSTPAEAMQVEITPAWCASMVSDLIVAKRSVHPNSFMANTIRNAPLEANHLADIMKTALDLTNGNLDDLDPTIKSLLESKSYTGVISSEKASELVLSCMGFGVDLPGVLGSSLSIDENKIVFMNFLSSRSSRRVHRDTGIYRNDREYPISQIYSLMSKGVEALPPTIQDLFTEHGSDPVVVNSLAYGLVNHLFTDGYLRFYFGGLVNFENYPQPPISMKDILMRHPSGKVAGYAMWRIVHSDIWDILRLADPEILKNAIQSNLDNEQKVFTEHTVFEGPQKGWGGQRKAPLSDCLPPDIYKNLFH